MSNNKFKTRDINITDMDDSYFDLNQKSQELNMAYVQFAKLLDDYAESAGMSYKDIINFISNKTEANNLYNALKDTDKAIKDIKNDMENKLSNIIFSDGLNVDNIREDYGSYRMSYLDSLHAKDYAGSEYL